MHSLGIKRFEGTMEVKEMEFKDIKEFIEQNKESNEELKAYLQGFKQFSVDEVQKLVSEKDDFKKWFDSEKDKHFSKGLDTWKTNNLEKLITDEIKKRFPEKDEKDIELEKIKAELTKIQQEKLYESLKAKALSVASDKKIPTSLIQFFIGNDEDATVKNLETFESIMETYVKAQVDERLKDSYKPPGNNNNFTNKNPWKKETFNLTEQARILKENPELAKQLMAQAK